MTRITHTIILTVVAIILALPLHSLAEDDYYYGADDDRVALSEERAIEVAKEAVKRLLEESREEKAPMDSDDVVEEPPIVADVVEDPSRGPATNIVAINSRSGDRGTVVTISGDGNIGKYHSFGLNDPTRLVVDILGLGSTLSSRTISIDIDSEFVDKVRVGAHPDKVRLVFDSPLTDVPEHSLSKSRGDLLVTFGEGVYDYEKEDRERKKAKDRKRAKEKREKERKKAQKTMERADMLKAITVYATDVPEMTKRFTEKTGYRLKRVSLNVRNPDNTPDYYERRILREFEAMQMEGSLKKTTVHKKVVSQDGGKYLRYMKPIVIERSCLNCHGRASKMPTDVKKFIRRFYPDDEATGYRLGEVRGAISVKIPVK